MKFTDKQVGYGIVLLIAIIVAMTFQQTGGTFSVVPTELDCPVGLEENSPCDGAVFTGAPKCGWDLSSCEDFCAADSDCIIRVPEPNDCSLFFTQKNVTQIGYCKYNFCQWQQIPTAERECTGSEMFLQSYKYYMMALAVLLILYGLWEYDWRGKKRGFF